MTRKKKSRKPGSSGPQTKSTSVDVANKKKRKGNSPGSRHSMGNQSSGTSTGTRKNTDSRIGNKTKIQLGSPKIVNEKPITKTVATPKQEKPVEVPPLSQQEIWENELMEMEHDLFMEEILEKLDQEISLDDQEQSYFDNYMERHQFLCQKLGIEEE